MANEVPHGDLSALLKPFHERANLAEERLEKLAAVLKAQKGSTTSVSNGTLDSSTELRAMLAATKAEQLADREKAAKEKEKLQYQILHLKRSLEEADKGMQGVASKK